MTPFLRPARRPVAYVLGTVGVGAVAAACGLGFEDIETARDLEDASTVRPDAPLGFDARQPDDARLDDANTKDGSAEDANLDAPIDAPIDATFDAPIDAPLDAADGGCTTLLQEDFATGKGLFTLAGQATVVGGRLQLLPDATTATNMAGAAYFNPPADTMDFDASFVVTTGVLAPINDTADGFAFAWLERAVPANPSLRTGNELGMTLEPGGQHGFATVFDIYPESASDRYFAVNEVGSGSTRTSITGGIFATLVSTSAVTLKYAVSRRGAQHTIRVERVGGAVATKVVTLGTATTKLKSFFFSTASGGAHSPGFFLDDVVIKSCP